jgi:hypothetical protein
MQLELLVVSLYQGAPGLAAHICPAMPIHAFVESHQGHSLALSRRWLEVDDDLLAGLKQFPDESQFVFEEVLLRAQHVRSDQFNRVRNGYPHAVEQGNTVVSTIFGGPLNYWSARRAKYRGA